MSTSTSDIHVHIPEKAFLPVYQHLINTDDDINFLWGGRDAGRSTFIAEILLKACMELPYFRCLLIKKTHNSIQEAQWQTLKDVAELWKIDHLFIFKTSPLSIVCKVNGNRFIARGADQPIKSVKDPSHAWYEEGNELTLNDFITVTTTLRATKVKIQQWFSFNPECDADFEDFWLYKTFFKGRAATGRFTWDFTAEDGTKMKYHYTLTHATYKDNRYCKPERKIFLEQLKHIDPYYYQVYTLGMWGRRKNNSPYFFAFDREKHLGKTKLDRRYEAMLSFDFNKNPITAQVWQYYGKHLYGIEAIKLENSDIYKLCDFINLKYPRVLWQVTGDATGKNSSALVQDNLNYYTVIKQKLNLGSAQIKVPTANPPLKENQVLCNAVLFQIKVTIDPDNCKPLVYDLENVRTMPDGSIEKRDREDPAQQADQADCFRYLCNQFFKWVLKEMGKPAASEGKAVISSGDYKFNEKNSLAQMQREASAAERERKAMNGKQANIVRVSTVPVVARPTVEQMMEGGQHLYLGDGQTYFFIETNPGPPRFDWVVVKRNVNGRIKEIRREPRNGRTHQQLISRYEAQQIIGRL